MSNKKFKEMAWIILPLLFCIIIGSCRSTQSPLALQKYELARKNYVENPSEETIIWYGRRAAYLDKFDEAIEIYSEGLNQFPASYRLYRHRGHRYISTRQFKKAISDLEIAAKLIKGRPLEVEEDGIPNFANIPVSNSQFNIWYHLGLAYYFTLDFRSAASAFEEGLKWANNDDLIVRTVDWLYMTYQRLHDVKAANELLYLIHEDMNVLEYHPYHNRLLVYKGLKSPDSMLKFELPGSIWPGSDYVFPVYATNAYGLANQYLYNGNIEKAMEIYENILETDTSIAFGYIAAEVDLKYLRRLTGDTGTLAHHDIIPQCCRENSQIPSGECSQCSKIRKSKSKQNLNRVVLPAG